MNPEDISPAFEDRQPEIYRPQLLEEATVGIGLFSGNELKIEKVNPAFVRLFGMPENYLRHNSLFEVLPGAAAVFRSVISQVLQGKKASLENVPVQSFQSGISYPSAFLDIDFRPFSNVNGKGIVIEARDVTEHVLVRNIIEKSESALALAVDIAELATWRIDLVSNKMSFSARLSEWLGTSEAEWIPDQPLLVHPDDRERIARAMQNTISGVATQFDEVYRIVHPRNGVVHTIQANGRREFDGRGETVAIHGTARDITPQRELQHQLEEQVKARTRQLAQTNELLEATNIRLAQSNRELLRSNEELAQFAYVATHDLQEPLRKIRFFSEHIARGNDLPEAVLPGFRVIERSAERMSLLIRDVLDFSRLLRYDTLYEPVDLSLIFREVKEDFDMLIDEKKVTVEAAHLPVIQGVRFQMQQLLHNLIGNALKFSRTGVASFVRISCEIGKEIAGLTEAGPEMIEVCHIKIQDNGIGFSQDYAGKIFEVFKRLHNRKQYSGNGIGLAVCKRIVENHQGRIFAEGCEESGAIFHVLLPLIVRPPEPAEA